MAFYPTVSYNPAPIFEGLDAGAARFAAGLIARQEKEEQDKDFKARAGATEKYLQSHAADFGWNADQVKQFLAEQPDETPRARYLRLNDAVARETSGVQMRNEQERARQEKELFDLKVDEAKRAMARQDRNQRALRIAMDPQLSSLAQQMRGGAKFEQLDMNAEGPPPVMAYGAEGGDDPHHLQTLAVMANASARRNKPLPQVMDLDGEKVIVDANGNVQQFHEPKGGKVTTTQVGGKNFTLVGTHLLDENGDPVTADKPMDPMTKSALLTQYQAAINAVTNDEQEGPGTFERRSTWSDRVRTNKQKANKFASVLGEKKMPYPDADGPASAAPAPATAAEPVKGPSKLYTVTQDHKIQPVGGDLMASLQQAVDDGAMSADDARAVLRQNGYTAKRK